jgi:diguanylate cyclase (GGDEF)-like protein/PAS domain S-box-containing protein
VSAAFDRLVDGVTDRFAEEYRIRRQDGGYNWVFDSAVAVERDGNRRARRIVGTSADIDARHRAAERLRESEQRLRLALEAAELAIWEVDLQDGGWLRIDGIGAEQLGRGRASLEMPLAGLRWLLGRRDDLRRLHRRYRAHAEDKAARILAEVQARRADSTVHWVEVYGIITERDADGRPLRLVGVTADVTRRKEAEFRLADLALQDHLTGLPNRRALDESLAQAVARARREGEPLALMLLDLDGFKQVNDALGHLAGDKVLAEAARRLRTCVRRDDAVARFGGDEFAVVASGFGDRRRLERLALRIAALLGRPVEVDGAAATAVIGVSIGIAILPDDGATPVELLGRADAALYAAKRARSRLPLRGRPRRRRRGGPAGGPGAGLIRRRDPSGVERLARRGDVDAAAGDPPLKSSGSPVSSGKVPQWSARSAQVEELVAGDRRRLGPHREPVADADQPDLGFVDPLDERHVREDGRVAGVVDRPALGLDTNPAGSPMATGVPSLIRPELWKPGPSSSARRPARRSRRGSSARSSPRPPWRSATCRPRTGPRPWRRTWWLGAPCRRGGPRGRG